MNELFKLKIITDVHCIICLEQSDITTVNWNQNYEPTEGWIQNHIENQNEKLISQADPTWGNFIKATHNVTQYCEWPPRVCMHSHQRLGMLLMSWLMVSWEISSQTWIGASVSSWTVCGGTWWLRMHRYTMSHSCSFGFIQELPTLATRGLALSCTRRNPGPTAPA